MKTKVTTFVMVALLSAVLILTGCSPANQNQVPSNSADTLTQTALSFVWPDAMHIAATGSSGEAKTVSWVSVMQGNLNGPILRVVNEAAWTNTYRDMAANKMILSQIDKSTLKDCIEGLNEYALPDGGPWPVGMVWVDSLASTGFMVRGDSPINKPEDVQPGTRVAIWNDKSATMNPFLSLLAWGNIDEKNIVWVQTGDYDAGPRAVVEGRADICMAAPVSPSVMEASAAPGGIKYISLDPDDNLEGARRFLEKSPLYDFGPIAVGPKSAVGTSAIISYKYLGANMATDTDLVYNTVKWLDENYNQYCDRYDSNVNMTLNDVEKALQTTYIPVHPGLVKYLQEKDIWNSDYERRNQVNIALMNKYITAYQDAMREAAAQNIEIKPNNPAWIEFWENYKLSEQIPLIQMHVSLTQDAAVVMPAGYQPRGATATPSSTIQETTKSITAAADIPFDVQKIENAHPGSDVTVVIKTAPGAEVTILFIMPNGSNSAYPKDNKKVAGPDGIITWTWNINNHVPAGEAAFTFTIILDGKQLVKVVKQVI